MGLLQNQFSLFRPTVLSLLLVTGLTQTQVPLLNWKKTLGGSSNDYAQAVTATADGGTVMAGYTDSNDGDITGHHGDRDAWAVRLNSAGSVVWKRTLGGTNTDLFYAITATSDGGVGLAGVTASANGDVSGHHGLDDAWIVKLNSAGDIVWQKTLGGAVTDQIKSISATSDGGFIVAGNTNSKDGDLTGVTTSYAGSNYWIIRLGPTGNTLWQKTYGGNGPDFAQVVKAVDGGFLVAGSTLSQDGDAVGSHGDYDILLLKLNEAGEVIWRTVLGGSGLEDVSGITLSADGNYVLAGQTSSRDGDVTGQHGDYDIWVVTLTKAGKIIWQKTLGGTNQDLGRAIVTTREGHYLIAGTTGSTNGDISLNQGGLDIWVIKLNPSGKITWEKTLGGSGIDLGNGIALASDYRYVVAGFTSSNDGDISGNHDNFDAWLAELEEPVLGIPTEKSPFSVSVSGNPTQNGQVVVEVRGAGGQPLSLQLSDLQGRLLTSKQIDRARESERAILEAGQTDGAMLLLQVSTPVQQKTLKILVDH